MHLNPTCPGTETKTLPDHHLSAWAELTGLHQGGVWSTFLLKTSLKDVPSRRNDFLGTHKWTPGLQSQGCRTPWAQRVEQWRAGRGRSKQKVRQPLAQICLCGHEESLCPHRQTQGWLSCILPCWMCLWAPGEGAGSCGLRAPSQTPWVLSLQQCLSVTETVASGSGDLPLRGITVPQWQSCYTYTWRGKSNKTTKNINKL